MKLFLFSLPKNIFGSFRGKNIRWHIIAIIATAVLVLSGLDWYYFTATREFALREIFFPAIIIGAFLPMFGLPLAILASWLLKKARAKAVLWTVSQAAVIGWLISSAYKALTGRIPPPNTIATDISNQFNFGFFEKGIFWGWPSSHTTVAFAMAFALIALYPRSKIIKILAFVYALYIGIGISFDIHWLSEFIAGAIIGAVIGLVVGRSFRKKI